MGCTPSRTSPPTSPTVSQLANLNNNSVKDADNARALITSPVRRMPPPLPSASTRSRPRLPSVVEEQSNNCQKVDMCSRRPLTTEERHLNFRVDSSSDSEDSASTHTQPDSAAAEAVKPCVKDGHLFEDPEFPAGLSALYYR